MRALYTLLLSSLLYAASATPTPPDQIIFSGVSVQPNDVAPLLSSVNAKVIDGDYIVVVKQDARERHAERLRSLLASSPSTFRPVDVQPFKLPGLEGYVIKSVTDGIIQSLRVADEVEFVERDQIVYATEGRAVEDDAPWGLARVSHRLHPTAKESREYAYYEDDGEGVTVYVVDTGINTKHVDFEGRAKWGTTVPRNDEDVDGNGHGTHVAGTIAGKRYGIAKKAQVVAVKVLRSNGSGTMSDVVRGIEWVVQNHRNHTEEAARATRADGITRKIKSVGNMSLGGGASRALNRAVDAAADFGVLFAVAAGNDNQDACQYSPASAEKPITVGATTDRDTMAWFSNYGKCTDIFAPGHMIESAWIGSNVATNVISGTSMATPHVAGIIAALMSRSEFEGLTPKELKDVVMKSATRKVITGIPVRSYTKNRLAYSLPPQA